MHILVASSPDRANKFAANKILEYLSARVHPVLGLATGASPLGTYRELIQRYQSGVISFASTTMFLLDEYIGLPAGHPQSFRQFIKREFTDAIDVAPTSVHVPETEAEDLSGTCQLYETKIQEAGGIDVQILGIGSNGHIAFNEPGSPLNSRTRLCVLSEQTRHDNARYFESINTTPTHGVSQGIGTILEARHIILIAAGAKKAQAIQQAVEGPVTPALPASALQTHPNTILILDQQAASKLQTPYTTI